MTYRPRHWISVEEYLHQEELAEYKSEYWNGEVFPLVSPPAEHCQIAANLLHQLIDQLPHQPWLVLDSSQLLKVPATGLYTYADAVVVDAGPQFEDAQRRRLLNPTLVAEVQSPTTQTYDGGNKFAHYQRLSSLRDYVLIASDARRIEVWSRPDQQTDWRQAVCMESCASMQLPSLGCTLSVERIYRKVETVPFLPESRLAPGPP